jgi:23S rRNA pseudouridine1911/1915/1917 synthase
MAVREGGRSAVTEWRVTERFGCGSLVEFRLHTGRTHQIRVHAAGIGHPVAGDATYGGRRYGSLRGSAACRKAVAGAPRQMLHAARLGFKHPVSGEPLVFEAPLPEDFAAVLRALRESC